MDMRCQDRAWVQAKLDMLSRTFDDKEHLLDLVTSRCGVGIVGRTGKSGGIPCGATRRALEPAAGEPSPIMDAMFARKEPKTGPDGTMSWSVDVQNPATDDNFAISSRS